MVDQNEFLKEESISDEDKSNIGYEQASNQFNKQDLDQVQFNTQNLHISVSDKTSSKILGVIFSQLDKTLLCNVEILLYFGDISNLPVKKCRSDKNGYFEFEDLPPGFYTLVAHLNLLEYTFQYIKVCIGQNIFQLMPISLK